MDNNNNTDSNFTDYIQFPHVQDYIQSISLDRVMGLEATLTLMSHANMLKQTDHLSDEAHISLSAGLGQILSEIAENQLQTSSDAGHIHQQIKLRLTELVGEQTEVLYHLTSVEELSQTTSKLWIRNQLHATLYLITRLRIALSLQAYLHHDTIIPSQILTPHAETVTLGHYLLAHENRLKRDTDRLIQFYHEMNECPMGSISMSGISDTIDRTIMSELLEFNGPTKNNIDALYSYDEHLNLLWGSTLLMSHISQLVEDFTRWSGAPMFLLGLPTETEQVLSVANAKITRLYSHLNQALILLHGTPLHKNKGLQELKAPVFDTIDVVLPTLEILTDLFSDFKIDPAEALDITKQTHEQTHKSPPEDFVKHCTSLGGTSPTQVKSLAQDALINAFSQIDQNFTFPDRLFTPLFDLENASPIPFEMMPTEILDKLMALFEADEDDEVFDNIEFTLDSDESKNPNLIA
ncbi:MAG: lyase family protein [Alcaligenaceae bacterium]|nr:lyase family protein [Alcaligenaceae bacterium]